MSFGLSFDLSFVVRANKAPLIIVLITVLFTRGASHSHVFFWYDMFYVQILAVLLIELASNRAVLSCCHCSVFRRRRRHIFCEMPKNFTITEYNSIFTTVLRDNAIDGFRVARAIRQMLCFGF